jgi:hypothetical protein
MDIIVPYRVVYATEKGHSALVSNWVTANAQTLI